MKMKYGFLVFVVGFTLVLAGCGGGGGSSSSGVDTVSASLKINALDLGKAVSYQAPSFAGAGGSGSAMEGFKVKVEKLELKKNDSTYVTVYSGSEYLETVGNGAGTFAGALNGTMPDTGTYTGYRLTTNGFRIKLKIVSGSTTYYTTSQTIPQGSVWPLSTSSASYDYITITQSTSETMTITGDFPTSLSVTANNDINLVWALKRNGIVSWEGSDLSNVTWAAEEDIVRAILPNKPSKLIQFSLTASALSNTISMLLDSSGNLIGGFCHRPTNKAINGSFMKGGSLSAVSNGGNTATFDVSFSDGDNNNDYYQITGNYNCGASTSGTYSSLLVTGNGVTPGYVNTGDTLTTTGAVTCGNII